MFCLLYSQIIETVPNEVESSNMNLRTGVGSGTKQAVQYVTMNDMALMQEMQKLRNEHQQAVERADSLAALVEKQTAKIRKMSQQIAGFLTEKPARINEQQIESHNKMDHFEVGSILDMRYRNNKQEFLIQWKGFSPNANTWEPEKNLDCDELLTEFSKRHSVKDFLLVNEVGDVTEDSDEEDIENSVPKEESIKMEDSVKTVDHDEDYQVNVVMPSTSTGVRKSNRISKMPKPLSYNHTLRCHVCKTRLIDVDIPDLNEPVYCSLQCLNEWSQQ